MLPLIIGGVIAFCAVCIGHCYDVRRARKNSGSATSP